MKTYTEQDLREALATDVSAPADMWPSVRSRISRRRRARVTLAAAIVGAGTAFAVVDWPGAGPDRISPVSSGDKTVLTLGLANPLPQGVTMDAVVGSLNARLAALGVSGTQVNTHAETIIVTVPPNDVGKLNDINEGGQLQLRQVLQASSQGVSSESRSLIGASTDLNLAESLFAHGRCANSSTQHRAPIVIPSPDQYLVGCSPADASEYLFAPSTISSSDVASAQAVLNPTTDEWVVTVNLDHTGAAAWQHLTATAVQQPMAPQCQPPGGCNAIGMLVDGRIIAVPSVQGGKSGLTGGQVQIAPIDTKAEAQALAVNLVHPLPVPLFTEEVRNSG